MSEKEYTHLDRCCQCSASLVAVDTRIIYCQEYDYCLEWDDAENVVLANGHGPVDCTPIPYKKGVGKMSEERRTTQKEAVLAHLGQGYSLTARAALIKLGVFRLAAVVHALKAEGHDIHAENIRVPTALGGEANVSRYWIPKRHTKEKAVQMDLH